MNIGLRQFLRRRNTEHAVTRTSWQKTDFCQLTAIETATTIMLMTMRLITLTVDEGDHDDDDGNYEYSKKKD